MRCMTGCVKSTCINESSPAYQLLSTSAGGVALLVPSPLASPFAGSRGWSSLGFALHARDSLVKSRLMSKLAVPTDAELLFLCLYSTVLRSDPAN